MIKTSAKLFFSAIAVMVLISFGCSKKDVTNKDTNADKQTQQNKTQQNTNQQNTQTQSTARSFAVKSVGESGSKDQMVDFTWTEDGAEKKLSDYKGKVIVLNFWATWCPPCKKELPGLSQIHNELKDKDFKMIGISVDDNQQVLDTYLKANALPYTVVFEPSELVGKYMNATGQTQNVVPQTYIIDKKGKVVEAILGARSKQDFLDIINKYL